MADDLGDVLMLKPEGVELESWPACRRMGRDHRPPAAGIARDRGDAERMVGGEKTGIDQRAQEGDGAGRVAARIGDARRPGDARRLAR